MGPKATFEDVTEWASYGDSGDETCEGRPRLWRGEGSEEETWVRVVGRRRQRTGKVAWYATNTTTEAFSPAEVPDACFARWPLQENRYREACGRVGLDRHHGYGKRLIANVAVIGKIEKLEGQTRRLGLRHHEAEAALRERHQEVVDLEGDVEQARTRISALRSEEDADIDAGRTRSKAFLARHRELRQIERHLDHQKERLERAKEKRQGDTERMERAERRIDKKQREMESLSRRQRIFTVDTELDEIMTAFKLTFVNLCRHFMDHYLGPRMGLDTLIKAILSLPGERVLTHGTETIRIYRYTCDP